jgi:hypothetical protein
MTDLSAFQLPICLFEAYHVETWTMSHDQIEKSWDGNATEFLAHQPPGSVHIRPWKDVSDHSI